MKLFSVIIIITIVVTTKSQNITKTKPYEPPPPPSPLECQPRRKLTVSNSPWIPGLYFLQEKNGKKERYRQCEVSLIADRVAITRAFCVPPYTVEEEEQRNGVTVLIKKKNEYFLRPTDSTDKDDFRLVINIEENAEYDLALLYVDRPICIDKICWPPKQDTYEWSHCFVVGTHRMLGDNEPEEETPFPCEIHYNSNLDFGMTKLVDEWSNYNSTKSIIHVEGKEDMGTCMVNSGSPMMCATKNSPNHYFQAGVVVDKTVYTAEGQYNCNENYSLENLCSIGNFTEMSKHCPDIDNNTYKDACYGFDIVNTGKEEIKTWIDTTVKNWKKNERPLAWKPICKDSGAVEVQYNEFPWMAAIFNSRGNSSRGTFVCAATVIHPQMALTRLECVENYRFYVRQLYLLTGVRNLDHVRENGEHERRRNLLDFRKISDKEEMVIIFWDEPLQNVTFPQLAQSGEHFHDAICLTLGWGLHSRVPGDDEPTYQATLKKAEVPTYNSGRCYNKLVTSLSLNLYPDQLDGFICAGGKHPTDVCLVDQGGPLVCQGDNHTLVLAGVMSYALGCGHEDTPNVYNSVGTYIKDIDKTINNFYHHSDNTESNDLDDEV
ncbi:uncharacterized protein [Anabrus simplex]|uniref:uncharacterized protein n=1 Tax=Anabrus simplex TaxID=316456 RepID=UPI0035A3D35E